MIINSSVKADANASNISSNIVNFRCWTKCWMVLRAYKIYWETKKKKKIVLDDVRRSLFLLKLFVQLFLFHPIRFSCWMYLSFIQHLVFHHRVECKTYPMECVSNVYIDIRMSIICAVPQKIKRREGHKQDKREETKMESKKEKYLNAKKDYTDDEISLLTDLLEANPCLQDVYHTDYTSRSIKGTAYTEIATSFWTQIFPQ